MRYRQALHGGDGSKVPVRAFRCDNCKQWHLTSMKKYDDAR